MIPNLLLIHEFGEVHRHCDIEQLDLTVKVPVPRLIGFGGEGELYENSIFSKQKKEKEKNNQKVKANVKDYLHCFCS